VLMIPDVTLEVSRENTQSRISCYYAAAEHRRCRSHISISVEASGSDLPPISMDLISNQCHPDAWSSPSCLHPPYQHRTQKSTHHRQTLGLEESQNFPGGVTPRVLAARSREQRLPPGSRCHRQRYPLQLLAGEQARDGRIYAPPNPLYLLIVSAVQQSASRASRLWAVLSGHLHLQDR